MWNINKNSRMSRREVLKGAGGVALALPLLECMGGRVFGEVGKDGAEVPKRFLGTYVGHGFAITKLPDNGSELRKWGWYPVVDGKTKKMRFGESMRGFRPFADRCSIIYGMEHPKVIAYNGHGTADSFLTGSHIDDPIRSPSLDQVAAAKHGHRTRFPSLVVGNEGGLGSKGVSKTLSFDSFGRGIPASNNLRYLFDRMFNNNPALKVKDQRRVTAGKRRVDLILESHKNLQKRISVADSQKMEQYLDTLNAVEKDIERMESWVDLPKPDVGGEQAFEIAAEDPTQDPIMSLKATVNEPVTYIRTMYNLIYLAFKTDSTRYATYMLQTMGGGAWDKNITTALGLSKAHHGLAHEWEHRGFDATKGKPVHDLARYDQFQGDQLSDFIKKLADTAEGDGNMLDHTIVLYGTSNSKTHANHDYPMLICGGEKLGLRQGKFHSISGRQPLTNLYVRLLEALDAPVKRFSDSTGKLEGTI